MSSVCVVCARSVRPRQHGLSCDKCGKWTHRTCGTGISAVEYREAVREDKDLPFQCKDCISAKQSPELELQYHIPAPRQPPIPAPRQPPIPAPRQPPIPAQRQPPIPAPRKLPRLEPLTDIQSPERVPAPIELHLPELAPSLTEQLNSMSLVDPDHFEVLPNGSKNCKDLLVDNRGFTYNIKRPTPSGRDWLCSVRGKDTYCRANVKERNGTFTFGANQHTHTGAPGIHVAKRIQAKVKNESVGNVFQSAASVAERVLFTMGDADLPTASRPKLHNLIRMASRARQQLRPKDPGPTEVDFEIATNFIPKDFLRADLSEFNQRILIFATDEGLDYLCKVSTWFVDGTFKVMRKPFDQLFSIHGFLSNDDGSCLKQVPLLFAFMTRKKTEDYVLVFKKILELAPRPPVVEVLVADFEKATWAASRQVMPSVVIRGCQFHWGQRVWRKAQGVGLQEKYNVRGEVYKVVRGLMSLPYLPVEEVAPVFHATFGILTDERLLELRKYVDDNWMNSSIFPVASWNVFRRPTRTNNDCEKWHRRINHSAGDATAFYQIVPLLYEEATKLKLQKVMVEEGALKRIQRRAVRERQQKFFDLWDKYDAGDVSGSELLQLVSIVVGPVLQ